jgi:epoxyqueuosine reductase QueG
VVDGSKCISYFTIELKESIPESMKGSFNDWAFGCDIVKTYVLGINFLKGTTSLYS